MAHPTINQNCKKGKISMLLLKSDLRVLGTDPFVLHFFRFSAFDLPLWVEKAIYEGAAKQRKEKIDSPQSAEL